MKQNLPLEADMVLSIETTMAHPKRGFVKLSTVSSTDLFPVVTGQQDLVVRFGQVQCCRDCYMREVMSKIRHKKQAAKRQSVITMDERHKRILDLLEAEGEIKVEHLADRLNVSQVN
jgi:hypothetical protein